MCLSLLIAASIISQSIPAAPAIPATPDMPAAPDEFRATSGTLPIPYASVEGWDVMIDMDMAHTCFVMGRFETGTTIRLGVDRTKRTSPGYVVLANPSWQGYKDGGEYELSIRFDRDKPWKGAAKASTSTGITALVMPFTDPHFVRDFAIRQAMYVERDGREIARLDLSSSQKAVASMLVCQAEVDETVEDVKEQEATEASTTV